MTNGLRWYNAILLVDAQHPDEPDVTDLLTERRVIVVQAPNDEQASTRARELCASLSIEYRNPDGHRVRWVCREVIDVNPLHVDAIVDGTEVFSEMLPGAPNGE